MVLLQISHAHCPLIKFTLVKAIGISEGSNGYCSVSTWVKSEQRHSFLGVLVVVVVVVVVAGTVETVVVVAMMAVVVGRGGGLW